MLPKVTIITVCYNAGKHIEKTIQSVINQDYDNLEYIIIDGGSKDDTIEIINKYIAHITYFCSEKDNGIYDAMNKGVEHATGEWVNFMNAGDSFTDSHVVTNIFGMNKIDEHIKVIGGNVNHVYSDHIEEVKAAPINVMPAWMPFNHQSMFVRTNLCTFDLKYKFAADYNLLYSIYYKYGEESIFLSDVTVADFLMVDSTSYTNLRKTKWESLKIQSAHMSFFWIKEFVKWLLHK